MNNNKPYKGYTKLEFVLSGFLIFSVFLAVKAMLPSGSGGDNEASLDELAGAELDRLSNPGEIDPVSGNNSDSIPSIKGKKNLPTPGSKKAPAAKPTAKPAATPQKAPPKPGTGAKKPPPKPAPKPNSKPAAKPPAKKPPAKRPQPAQPARKAASSTKLIRVPEELRVILTELENSDWSREIEVKMLAAIKRWGVKDPAQALDFSLAMERRGTRNGAMGRILPMWAKESPQDAMAWFQANAQDDPYLVQDMTGAFYNWIAAKDIQSAYAGVWDLPTAGMRRAALNSVSQRLVILGKEERVLQAYESATTLTDQKMVIDTVMAKMARYEPEALGQWVASLPDPKIQEHGVNRLVANWSRDHPSAAAEWVMGNMEASKLRGAQIATVTRSWVHEDPIATADWLVGLPLQSGETDAAVDAFSRAVLPQNSEYAGAWSFSVQNNGTRWRLQEHIGRTWLKQSPAEAREYINKTDLPAATKTRILGN